MRMPLVRSHLLLLAALLSSFLCDADDRRPYLVHLHPSLPAGDGDLASWHQSFLPAGLHGDRGRSLIYSYAHVFPGFAAALTAAEADAMAKVRGVLRLHPEVFLPLATTHSPDFLGLHDQGVWKRDNHGEGVIIGILDSGVLPEHPSFRDDGLPPPPRRWRGRCDFPKGLCSNKIIGARAFGSVTPAPLDDAGHGTHTASTAGGNFVKNAGFRGEAEGTASGMAPRAHLAIYKVCTRSRCSILDILAGMDAAVSDGVDIISLSIGASFGAPFNYDPVAIAAFNAMAKGILVSCAAGNNGPAPETVGYEAPWMLTVAASTMDRSIRSTVRLGNGEEFHGETLYQPSNFSSALLQLVYPGIDNASSSRDCSWFAAGVDVSRKIVLCESRGLSGRVEQGFVVSGNGGAAMIIMNQAADGYTTFADPHVLPASHVSHRAGAAIVAYINSTRSPVASIIFKGTVLGSSPAPAIASFSARGPTKASPGILKPDITGPGMNILAAWAPEEEEAPVSLNSKERTFKIVSGTSMATPHLSGVAALIKSAHPDWSPAAVKSAIMTTSDTSDNTGKPIKDEQYKAASFFAMGAGFVNPSRAINPGLIYDIAAADYIAYLCGLGLGDEGISSIAHRNVSCSGVRNLTEAELNLPSLVVGARSPSPLTVHRTVTNVGKASSKYRVRIDMPGNVLLTVQPRTLRFSTVNEKKTYTVTVQRDGRRTAVEGSLRWVSDEHAVRLPVVIQATT